MASTTFQIYTGWMGITPRLALFGFLLLTMSRGTSGSTSPAPATSMAASTPIATPMSGATSSPNSGSGTPTTTMMMTTTEASMSTAMPISSTTTSMAASPNAGTMTTSASTTMPMSGATTTMSPNAGSGHPTMMTMSPSTGSMAGSTMTTMDMIYCPVFSCNCSECNAMYASQNATRCASGEWCQLLKMDMMYYMANCSATCSNGCANATDANCAVACCNATGCLADTFASLVMMTSTAVAPTTPSVTMAMSVAPTQPATTVNGNKCHQGTCTGATCYTSFSNTLQTCSSTQLHCQLEKEQVNSDTLWTASCATNCSATTPCKDATPPPCFLECCKAAGTSCLWLNGTLNHVSSNAAGPRLRTGLTTSALCLLLALSLLL
ncbi:uncharacterized protein LOC144057642 isoform X3 [Vanacampus margaritifer]